ncbi:MAG: recombinase XerC, partial [Chloroflexi bacterium]|nr:recombinase XerC [Chloroflexota bacterium]
MVLDVFSGLVHSRADKFLSSFGEGTQRTYAYHLVDHLRWLAANGYREDSITIQDLLRYLALCGSQHYGPLGSPWRADALGDSALAVRTTCLKGYYLDLTTREQVSAELRAALSIRRLPN